MIKMSLISISMFILFSCKSRYNTLTTYYKENVGKHIEVADSLLNFNSFYGTDLIIRKRPEGGVIFGFHSPRINTYVPILFDSALKRTDPYPNKTSKVYVSLDLIKSIQGNIYHAIKADSIGVFFGYKYYSSEYEYGILIFKDEKYIVKNNIIKRLSKNACIYKDIIP